MKPSDEVSKLTSDHLARKAVVYLHQSSLAQVQKNQESQRLQYALAETAKRYGFQHVEVIDCDLGQSAPAAPGSAKASSGYGSTSPWGKSGWCSAASSHDCRARTRTGAN